LVRSARRFSEAISEGDGISVLVEVADEDAARSAEAQGAEGLVLTRSLPGVREASTLPILWRAGGTAEAAVAGADAFVLVAGLHEREGELERAYAQSLDAGLDVVVAVSSEEELERVLELVDPEIVMLSAGGADGEAELDHVLDLLPDVPAGKLAIAAVSAPSREAVMKLERAGVDAVLVAVTEAVAELVGGHPPEV
jgi:indole-3-glycerol phosphate synthase